MSFDNQLELGNLNVFDGKQSISFEAVSTYGKQLINDTSQKNAYLSRGGWYEYLKYMIQDDIGFFIDIVNKKSNLNSERYVELLRQTKDLLDKGYWASEGSINFYNMEYHFATTVDFLPVQAAFYDLDPNSRTCYSLRLSDANGNVYISPNNSIAINTASKNKELAWEFIKYLLSDEIQSLPSFNTAGFGINKTGFNASIEKNYAFYSEKNKGVDKEAYKNLLEQWVMQINAYETLDPVIEEILKEENSKFMEGKQSAEETARVLQAKIDKYFNE